MTSKNEFIEFNKKSVLNEKGVIKMSNLGLLNHMNHFLM